METLVLGKLLILMGAPFASSQSPLTLIFMSKTSKGGLGSKRLKILIFIQKKLEFKDYHKCHKLTNQHKPQFQLLQ